MRADRTIRIPAWCQHYSLDEALETLPLAMPALDTVQAAFVAAGVPDPYGDKRYPLSWYWRKLQQGAREALQAAYEKDQTYRAELAPPMTDYQERMQERRQMGLWNV